MMQVPDDTAQPSGPPSRGPEQSSGNKLRLLRPLAIFMATNEDLNVFRRFDEVNILNLLVLQDELEALVKDVNASLLKTPGQQTWDDFGHILGAQPPPPSKEQSEKVEEDQMLKWEQVRKKLSEYNRALIEIAQIRNLDPPEVGDIRRIRAQLKQFNLAPQPISSSWNKENDDDFVLLPTAAERGSKINVWLKFVLGVIRWHLKDMKRAPINVNNNGEAIVVRRDHHMSRAQRAEKLASTSRFAMALFGGVALIVPTVIMAKFEGVNVSLITTSVSVLVFALVLAYGATDSTGKDVLTATAAYTAVLVVFVGTSLSGNGSTSSLGASSNATGLE